MRCPHCKAQWQLPPDYNQQRTSCPFCGGDLYVPLQEPYDFSVLIQELVSRFGLELFSDYTDMRSAIDLIAPNLEKEKEFGLLFFLSCGGVEKLASLKNAVPEDIDSIFTDQVNMLKNIVDEVCNAFLSAVGVSKPLTKAVMWDYIDAGNDGIKIISHRGSLPAKIEFPAFIDDKPVTVIGKTALGPAKLNNAERSQVVSIIIPETVVEIEESAFYGCKALANVVLPEGLRSIGDKAFKNCTKLGDVSLPSNLEAVGDSAFSDSGICSLVLPGTIGSVSRGLFKNCKQLRGITIQDGVTEIQDNVFHSCKALTTVTFPETLTSIGDSVFCGCEKIKVISLPDSLTTLGSSVFSHCCKLNSINIPPKVTTLDYSVFQCCDFTSFDIPHNVRVIREDAFYGCWSLEHVTIPRGVVKIEKDAFYKSSDLCIACYKDSCAHKWAERNKIKFELLDEPED